MKLKLNRDEIAREIHMALRELYPNKDFSAEAIHRMLKETASDGMGFRFAANEYAQINGLGESGFVDKLYKELGIEFEKNWHDKSFFEMTRDKDSISLKVIE